MQEDRGRPLPKFGEWDVNNPASADGFTVIFAKARDDKKTNGNAVNGAQSAQKNDNNPPRPDLNSQVSSHSDDICGCIYHIYIDFFTSFVNF